MIHIKKGDLNILFIIIILIIISILIFQSFIIPIIFTFLLVYILNPIYIEVKNVLKSHTLSSLIVIIFFFMLFLLPIAFTTIQLSKEINSIDNELLMEKIGYFSQLINDVIGIDINIESKYNLMMEKADLFLDQLFFKVPELIFNIFIIIFFYYYFSKDFDYNVSAIKSFLKGNRVERIEKNIKQLTYGIIYGQIFVRFIQAIIATLCFLLIGINGAIFWGIMVFFVAFLPILGASIVWFPLAIFYFIEDQIVIAILIILAGTFISTVDNILLPYIISGRTRIGPVITLISIFGGLKLFGFYGVLLGPFIIGVMFVLIEEMFYELSDSNPKLRKFIWTEAEREKLRNLKSKIAKEEYIRMVNEKYEKKTIIKNTT